MVRITFLTTHRTWEDWLGIGLGVVIGFSPWLAGPSNNDLIAWNAMAVGLTVLLLASLELDFHNRGGEVLEATCGAWLIASPFALGYAGAGSLKFWHFVLGAVVLFLATLEFVQDTRSSGGPSADQG